MSTWVVEEPNTLREVARLLHDGWIAFDELIYDRNSCGLSMQCTARRLTQPGKPARGLFATAWKEEWLALIKMEKVLSVDIVDEAKIGGLNLSSIAFDTARNTVSFEGGIPARVQVGVAALRMRVQDSNEILSRQPTRVIWPFYLPRFKHG